MEFVFEIKSKLAMAWHRIGKARPGAFGFGPFDFAFKPDSATGVPPYLELLNLTADADRHFHAIVSVAAQRGSRPYIIAMLRDIDWRPHLVGIVAASASTGLELELWSAIDRASWATPQIAAVLSVIDNAFANRANRRLSSGCFAEFKSHDSRSDPAAVYFSEKMAGSLSALLGQQVEPPDLDSNGSEKIAQAWRERFIALSEARHGSNA